MPPKKVTDTHILQVIDDWERNHAYAMTVRDVMQSIGFATTSSTLYRIRTLRKAGLIHMEPGIFRSIRLSAAGITHIEKAFRLEQEDSDVSRPRS